MNHRYQLRKSIKEKLENGDRNDIINMIKTNCSKLDLSGLEIRNLVINNIHFLIYLIKVQFGRAFT